MRRGTNCGSQTQELSNTYEPGKDWNLESLVASPSVIFGSVGANLGHSVTTIDQSSIQNLDTGILETADEALARRHPNTISPIIHDPNHALRQEVDFQSGLGGMNGKSKEPTALSNIDGNPRRFIMHRIDELSHRAGHDDSRVLSSIDARKRKAPEDSAPSRAYKKRKIEPPPNVPPVHKPSHSLPPTHSSKELERPRGGKKCSVRPLSTMRKEDHYYRRNTSLDDQTYFGDVIEKLRAADYLQDLQGHEPTISSEAGVSLVGEPRVNGPGRAKGGEPVYAILVDKPSSGPLVCWICGHLEKQRKHLRILGHVREHFEHKSWTCTQDHRAIRRGTGQPEGSRVRGKDGPWWGPPPISKILTKGSSQWRKIFVSRGLR